MLQPAEIAPGAVKAPGLPADTRAEGAGVAHIGRKIHITPKRGRQRLDVDVAHVDCALAEAEACLVVLVDLAAGADRLSLFVGAAHEIDQQLLLVPALRYCVERVDVALAERSQAVAAEALAADRQGHVVPDAVELITLQQ